MHVRPGDKPTTWGVGDVEGGVNSVFTCLNPQQMSKENETKLVHHLKVGLGNLTNDTSMIPEIRGHANTTAGPDPHEVFESHGLADKIAAAAAAPGATPKDELLDHAINGPARLLQELLPSEALASIVGAKGHDKLGGTFQDWHPHKRAVADPSRVLQQNPHVRIQLLFRVCVGPSSYAIKRGNEFTDVHQSCCVLSAHDATSQGEVPVARVPGVERPLPVRPPRRARDVEPGGAWRWRPPQANRRRGRLCDGAHEAGSQGQPHHGAAGGDVGRRQV
jgi:hypothetical protein